MALSALIKLHLFLLADPVPNQRMGRTPFPKAYLFDYQYNQFHNGWWNI
jgi:hypothetical protein